MYLNNNDGRLPLGHRRRGDQRPLAPRPRPPARAPRRPSFDLVPSSQDGHAAVADKALEINLLVPERIGNIYPRTNPSLPPSLSPSPLSPLKWRRNVAFPCGKNYSPLGQHSSPSYSTEISFSIGYIDMNIRKYQHSKPVNRKDGRPAGQPTVRPVSKISGRRDRRKRSPDRFLRRSYYLRSPAAKEQFDEISELTAKENRMRLKTTQKQSIEMIQND